VDQRRAINNSEKGTNHLKGDINQRRVPSIQRTLQVVGKAKAAVKGADRPRTLAVPGAVSPPRPTSRDLKFKRKKGLGAEVSLILPTNRGHLNLGYIASNASGASYFVEVDSEIAATPDCFVERDLCPIVLDCCFDLSYVFI